MTKAAAITGVIALAVFVSCERFHRDDYQDNSPTSGKLKVYYDEGLRLHVLNQVFTFEAQYERVDVEPMERTDDQCVIALLNDSCEAIFISRLLNEQETHAFSTKKYNPRYSHVATSGIALIANTGLPLRQINAVDLGRLLQGDLKVKDSTGKELDIRFVIDRSNSSVMRFLMDSLMPGKTFGAHCSSTGSSPAAIEYVAKDPGTIAVVDFAWMSDRDDTLFKRLAGKVRFLGLRNKEGVVSYPSQSSFKTGEYPLSRKIYVMRKTGEFTLAKGFESFVAGPKGQLTFLKQGLLPARQAERNIEISMEPMLTE